MNYTTLTELLKTITANTLPTKEALKTNIREAIHFWGNDSESWMVVDGESPIHFKPDDSLGPSFSVVGDGVQEYEKFIDEIKSDATIKKYVHDKSIEKTIEELLRKIANTENLSDSEITESIREKINDLKDSIIEWEGFAPIQFLIFRDFHSLKIGKVEFSSSEDTARIAITKISDSIDANSSPPDEKEGMKKVMELAVSSQLGMALVCAKVVVKGESSNVKVLVEEEVETSLNLLRCYTHVLFHPKLRAGMGLLHETGVYHRPVIGLSTTDHSWTLDSANVGINHHFELSAASVGYLRRSFALQELSNVLAKEDSERSKLEKLIVTAIRWLGRGIVDSDNPNKVLHFAAACENLIMGQQMEGEISEKFSRRIAFLIGENPEERKYLYARCKKLYNQRSKVIHSGSTNVNPIDVAGLEMITLRALVKIAQRLEEWSTHQDFVSWFENESFGVTGPNTVPA